MSTIETFGVGVKHGRKDPTNQLIFPKLPPKDRVREYNESKNVKTPTRTKFLYKEPANIELEVYKRRRELEHSDRVLRHIMLKAKELRGKMDVEWANLKDKAIEFRNNIIYFDKFVNENREKRERAVKKITEERIIYQQRSAGMRKLQEKMDTLIFIKAKREEQIRQYKMYEAFLFSVVALRNREFRDIEAVMVRYDILRTARYDIIDRQEAQINEMGRYKQHMTGVLEEKRLKMLRLSVTASDLLTRWGTAKYQALRWENALKAIKENLTRQHVTIESVKFAADNLYVILCSRQESIPMLNLSVEDKFTILKDTLGTLKRVLVRAPNTKVAPVKKKQFVHGRKNTT